MNAQLLTNRKFARVLTSILSIFAILAIALPVTQVAYAVSSSPFVGHWQAADIDGSDIRMSVGGPPNGPFQITWTESYISFCDGEAGIVRGTGQLDESDPNLLAADLHLACLTTGTSLDFHFAWRYHPLSGTLSSKYENGAVIIWRRPGNSQPPPPMLNLRVNYGHDWVESFYEGGHMAWITVTESDGVTVKATAELVTEPKDYWGGEPGFQSLDSVWLDAEGNQLESPPDILPNDRVFGWVDNGASAQMQIGEISGTINLVNDSIEGTITASWFTDRVNVECLDWGSGGEPFSNRDGGSVLTNGADPYSCSWAGEWDIRPGQDVGVGYSGPDGHWVANAFFVPQLGLRVNYGHDWVESFYEAGHAVTVTLAGSDGVTVKATAELVTEPKDYWGGEPGFQTLDTTWFDAEGNPMENPPDIQPNDWVFGWADNGASAQVQIGEIRGMITLVTDSIEGTIYAPWFSEPVQVECLDWGSGGEPFDNKDGGFVVANDSEPYFCSWAGEWDIQSGQTVGVGYSGLDGHWVANAFFADSTINVTGLADVIANDGVCTLREAVIAANTNSPSGDMNGECQAGTDSQMDTIFLTAGNTYSLTIDRTNDTEADGDLDIWNNSSDVDLVIKAEGDGKATISQDALSVDDRVLENHEATVQIENLILTGGSNVGSGGGLLNNGTVNMIASDVSGNSVGWDGGGIYNSSVGTLSVDSSTVTGNSSSAFAGGIMNKGTLTIYHSEVTSNTDIHGGGGINNEGTLTIENSVLSSNSSGQGGALYNTGTATIMQTTIGGSESGQGNIASDGGGGLFSLGTLTVNSSIVVGNSAPYGGGLFNWTGGMLTVSNSTVSGNSANQGGGLENKEGSTAVIQNGSIFSNNYAEWSAGGIDNNGTITITGSVLRENTSLGVGDALRSFSDTVNATTITASCIVGNGDVAVFNERSASQNATGNWWGEASGPSGVGSGTGDSVSDFIDFSGWLAEAPSICAP